LELAKIAERWATWLHKTRSLPKDQFKRIVEKELTEREPEPWEIFYFKLLGTRIPVVEQAIETGAWPRFLWVNRNLASIPLRYGDQRFGAVREGLEIDEEVTIFSA
jgi:hypothetical protein